MKVDNKIVISRDLRARLVAAKENGSVVAADILEELKKDKVCDVFKNPMNYFATRGRTRNCRVRKCRTRGCGDYRTIDISITYCSGALTNPKENRVECAAYTFAGLFKNLKEYTDEQLSYFSDAICCSYKIRFKLETSMKAIERAYNERNYAPYCSKVYSNLQSSSMRHSELSKMIADFYYNFAGAKVLVAYDDKNRVLGRAVVWPDVSLTIEGIEKKGVSVIDCLYYSFSFIGSLMLAAAKARGISLCKRNNMPVSKQFKVLNSIVVGDSIKLPGSIIDVVASVTVPKRQRNTHGAPYLDTFYALIPGPEDSFLLMNTNTRSNDTLALLQSTDGCASVGLVLCPICGKLHDNEDSDLCFSCYAGLIKTTPFGTFCNTPLTKYKNYLVPSVLLTEQGEPTPEYARYLKVRSLLH